MRIMYPTSIRFFHQSGLICARGTKVHRRLSGVSIGGVPWSTGMHCLYRDGPGINGINTLLGCVVGMFHGKDDMMDDFVLFQLKRQPITTRMGHYCWFSGATQNTDLVVWTEIYWKYKVLKGRGGGRHGAAVHFV